MWAGELRRELSVRAQQIAAATGSPHELTPAETPSIIFGCDDRLRHGNFYPPSYRNICANPEWVRRLAKVHTSSRRASSRSGWRWKELDCANSSDALLMNIFCCRRSVVNRALCSMLGVHPGLVPEYGFKPRIPLRNGKADQTEIDMRLGGILIEAKLTETDFQTAPIKMITRYRSLEETFDLEELIKSDVVRNYQLIRGVLAAFATGGSFCVLCDSRRPDLIERWYSVIRAVRNCDLRCRMKLLTWQEIAAVLSRSLQSFLAGKYGVEDPAVQTQPPTRFGGK